MNTNNGNLSLDMNRTQTNEFKDPRTCQSVTKPKRKLLSACMILEIQEDLRLLKEKLELEEKTNNEEEAKLDIASLDCSSDETEKENVAPPLESEDDDDSDVTKLESDIKKVEVEYYTPAKNPIETKTIKSTQPKVQYSMNVDSYLKTPVLKPLFKTPTSSSTTTKGRYANKFPNLNENQESKLEDLFKTLTVNNTRYVVLNVLGKGGSSIVYDCYVPETKLSCAIKCVDLNQDQGVVSGFVNEVKTLERLKKCNKIIKLYAYEIVKEDKKLYMVLEKGEKDLSHILRELDTSNHLPMYKLMYIWMEMLYAVKQIHMHNVIHSDLKPANFLQIKENIKLIDFGIATCMQKEMTSIVKNIALGTFSYISPEALRNESSNDSSPGKQKFKISYKSDVWSLGCILYQLVYRKTPFQHIGNTFAKISTIMDPNHKIEYPPVNWVPEKILNTIKQCLQYDMRSRPSIDELIRDYENIYY